MEWTEEAVILGARRHGESHAILEVMTGGRGRHLGLVRGGASGRLKAVLQPGNTVVATWRARLDEHLGTFAVESLVSRTARLIASPLALNAVALVAAHARALPERDPHPALFDALIHLLDALDEAARLAPLLARFEFALLAELGFGLDLSSCVASGAREDLTHVSPKSGRAVSREAAAPYRDRLLALPSFLREEREAPDAAEIADAFRLTGFFLARHVWEPRGTAEPECRRRVLDLLARGAPPAAA